MESQEPETPYLPDFSQQLIECCRAATLDMIKEMALHDELVVTADRNGKPIWVKAREILDKNPDLTKQNVDYVPVDVNIDEILNNKNNSVRYYEPE